MLKFTKWMVLGTAMALAAVAAQSAAAADTNGVSAAVRQKIKERVQAQVPEIPVNSIRPAPIPGWYEVTLGAKLVYVSADARYLFFGGDLMDLKEGRDLSDKPRAEARQAALAAISDKTIEFAPKGPTKHVIYVFTDVDCPYCRKFHQEVGELNKAGIAVRYLAFPRSGVGSPTYKTMESVWCAADPKAALTEAKEGKELAAVNCPNPVKEEFNLGRSMGVRGTPTVLDAKGQELGGYIPANQLIRYFNGS